jgi:hypothetical protein
MELLNALVIRKLLPLRNQQIKTLSWDLLKMGILMLKMTLAKRPPHLPSKTNLLYFLLPPLLHRPRPMLLLQPQGSLGMKRPW